MSSDADLSEPKKSTYQMLKESNPNFLAERAQKAREARLALKRRKEETDKSALERAEKKLRESAVSAALPSPLPVSLTLRCLL